ncbi:uncharacterized protein LOC110944536 [Helianthus annuus]|uniref:uncharacterized protein LOC110944536 n=1 Tax=Helianthus annuus TaxID=4232 RepID=UPI000B9011C6|nr:uncharacterized protein LOC110944536 [Helianthus annuus]
MKSDWKLYDRLMRIESGLGWDPVKKTINSMSEWWDEKIQADPELAKFKNKNLEMYQEFYEPLFRDCVATGDKTKPPHQLQNEISQSDVQDDIGVMDVEGKADSDEGNLGDDAEKLFPKSNFIKRRKIQDNAHGRSSRGKSTIASSLEVKLDMVIEALSSQSTPNISMCALMEIPNHGKYVNSDSEDENNDSNEEDWLDDEKRL